jgi:hypothetical protein
VSEVCPSCHGQRVTDTPDRLLTYEHESWCLLAEAEREQYAADLARHRRRGRTSWHRPANSTERVLLAASGMRVTHYCEVFTRVEWPSPTTRVRTWSRLGLVAETTQEVR